MLKTKVRKLPKSEMEIEGELEAEIFENYYPKALKKIGENLEVAGFRKGKVPENVLLKKVPEIKILEEMAEMALVEHYPKIIEQEKIMAIARPEISITKIARKNPLGFKIKTAVVPETKLPDYKKIAQRILRSDLGDSKRSDLEVTEKEIEDTILDIRKSRAPKIHVADSVKDTKDRPLEDLPEFNDEFVKSLGSFKDIADFKEKLKENIKSEKENQLKEKTRLKIAEKIIEETEVDMPELLINIELDKIIYRMESDISALGLKFEDYLKQIKKTEEDIRKDFYKEAEKKAKLALILNKIAETEKIKADPEQVNKEVAMILEHYQNADPDRAQIHAENVLTNEKVFQFLENQ
jgi:FKBP-type peptidyl-prolyl cis-trans isomerase (trigger factor)